MDKKELKALLNAMMQESLNKAKATKSEKQKIRFEARAVTLELVESLIDGGEFYKAMANLYLGDK